MQRAYKRSCTYFSMKIEDIKARYAPIVYIMVQRTCSTKKSTRTVVTHYLEHRVHRVLAWQQDKDKNLAHRLNSSRATATHVYNQIQQQILDQRDRVKQADPEVTVLPLSFGITPSKCRCPMHSVMFGLVCF